MDFGEPTLIYSASCPHTNEGLGGAAGGDILVTPVSEEEVLIVTRPSNPTTYASDNEIFYTRMYIDAREQRMSIRTAVRIGGESTEQRPREGIANDFISCEISATFVDLIRVPAGIRDELISTITRLGGTLAASPSTGSSVSFRFPDSFDITTLPSLSILIQTEDGREVQIAQLDPADYLQTTRDSNEYRILFEHTQFTLTKRTIQNLLIHVEYENHRVGFADPLVEL